LSRDNFTKEISKILIFIGVSSKVPLN
jgi:hypothetical protein